MKAQKLKISIRFTGLLLTSALLLSACGGEAATLTTTAPTATIAATTAQATTAPTSGTTAAATATMPSAATAEATTGAAATSGTTPATTARGGTFTFAIGTSPAALDPSTGDAANEYYYTPAYDSLISFDYDGQYKPLLATSWKWEGTDFKTFDMELRPNVKYSDGEDFNAKVVKDWLDLQQKNKSPVANNLGLESVETTGDLSVKLHLTAANPLVPLFLTRTWLSGIIPCPKAVADPTILKAATCGVGPYMLDTANTVTGSSYTYIPNPNYWNPSAIHFDKLVYKVVANSQAGVDAIRAGQADVNWPADASLIDTAVGAGLQTTGVSQNVIGLDFLDKTGAIVPALKDVRVRQALNYAVDRASLAKALGGGKGDPTSTQFIVGSDGHDPAMDNYYPYDVNKAKQLLSDAGFANGFDVTILTSPIASLDTAAQAIASYWQAVGVNATLDNKPAAADFFAGLTSGKYGVAAAALGATNPTLLAWNCCFGPNTSWNRDTTAPSELTTLVDKLRVTDPTQFGTVATQINDYMTTNAWYVPVYTGKLNYLFDPKKVTLAQPSGAQPVINVLDITPAK